MGAYLSSTRDAYARSLVQQVLSALRIGRLHILLQYPGASDEKLVFGQRDGDVDGQLVATLIIRNENIWWKACRNMDLAMAEGYFNGDVDCDDWVKLFMIYIANRNHLSTGTLGMQLIPRLQQLLSSGNTLAHTRSQISSHYDSSNAHFQGFLSEDMNYSSPIWELGRGDEALEDAQRRKVRNALEQAHITADDHVLDIGCGWGDLAIEAARSTGCRVTGVTLSAEQKTLAEERIRAAGLEEKISILLCDYREIPEVPGGYDKVVSIEMIEHVGRKHYPVFFETISRLLNPTSGVMVLQAITVVWDRHEAKLGQPEGFIDRYIFPGGYIPHTHYVLDTIHRGSRGTLEIRSVRSIGPHYVKALRMWREKFLLNWEAQIKPALVGEGKTDEAALEFLRKKWEYYFSYCEAGFRSGMLGDVVVTASRPTCLDLFDGVPL
ncbi:cyclopropane-fatty-acyl-phospholipid synthase [Auricularia subglabra TFB-10046 SS5]|nr:cyclopropane-fatty-acyl-phospholipid synthase [Auricularia subglabra TFB-10046 SS5]